MRPGGTQAPGKLLWHMAFTARAHERTLHRKGEPVGCIVSNVDYSPSKHGSEYRYGWLMST